MFRLTLAATLVASTCTAGQPPEPAGSKLKAFEGVWATARGQKNAQSSPYQLVLEFKGDELTFFTERNGKKENAYTLSVSGPETNRTKAGLIESDRLILTHGSTRYALYYEFVGDRLVLVGNLPNRPFEGFSLSGEFTRVEAFK